MTLKSSDLESDSDLDSIRNSCDVFVNVCILNILSILSILYIPIEETNGVSSKQSPQNPWA